MTRPKRAPQALGPIDGAFLRRIRELARQVGADADRGTLADWRAAQLRDLTEPIGGTALVELLGELRAHSAAWLALTGIAGLTETQRDAGLARSWAEAAAPDLPRLARALDAGVARILRNVPPAPEPGSRKDRPPLEPGKIGACEITDRSGAYRVPPATLNGWRLEVLERLPSGECVYSRARFEARFARYQSSRRATE